MGDKKYEDVDEQTLSEEFEDEDADVAVSVRDNDEVEEDGFITVYPAITTGGKDDNTP